MAKRRTVRRRKTAKKSTAMVKFKPKSTLVRYKNSVDLGIGFPKKITMVHKFSQIVSFTTTTGTPTQYVWSANSLYHPDISGGSTHDPYYFDQMTPLYDHYCVIGSRATVKIVPSGTATTTANANNNSMLLSFYVNDDTTATSTLPQNQAEYQASKVRLTGNVFDKPFVMTERWSARKYFGKGVLANDELQGTATTRPTEQSYYNLAIIAADQASTITAIAHVQIEYIAIWKEIRDVAAS